jgi:hypothetical protein
MPRKNNIDAEINRLTTRLINRATRSRRAGNRRLEEGALVIRDLARMYAPEDEGKLEAAIKVRKFKNPDDMRRFIYEVYVDESMPGSNGVPTVGHYALRMHESVYNLGARSRDKDLSVGGTGLGYGYGGVVGSKFLERAMDKYRPKIERQVRDAIKRELK